MGANADSGAAEGEHARLARRRAAVLPSWLGTLYSEPIDIESGSGRHVHDAEGNRYLDFFGGILTTMTGHAVPEVTEAVSEQAGRILHSSTLYLNEPMIELAERVAELSEIEDPRVFFTTSGTEANDTALLLATGYRSSNQILALRNSYHGRSFASLSVTGNRAWSPSSLSPVQTNYVHGSRRRGTVLEGLDDAEFTAACVRDLEDVLDQLHGNVACLIAEPIQGVGGFAAPPDGLFARFKEVLDRHGILWISDEVQTGWGRTGEHFWGWQAHDANGSPDIVTFAKGIGNGLPIAGVVARGEVMDSVSANSISTFGGSPLTAAGALANLEYHRRNDLWGNAYRVGAVLRDELSAAESMPGVGELRGKGLMLGVELLRPDGSPAPELAAETTEQARSRGLLIGKGGLEGNVLRIAPPLSLTSQEAVDGARILLEALRASGAEE
ncbi:MULTISPECIES: aspartate aminotransferase family protein [unclassified Actinopolyspora]|uniref:aspartate aminotransferase family protein n=1 Tax=unclassified Actinopolyspora TaxID=2639451 RepID=UPI0013F64715|nr:MULTISPECIES: aspartate aminotransferase family protein [unclassified Actinopolyspora]NHD16923.1 aspartate aminotransferase family protein [Actinopolyspora sp. BKK2]NHE76075.1 aspartate aminotransferase family protein [Actinopolyspora sp. BKK1]